MMRNGGQWYGWTSVQTSNGSARACLGQRIVPFSPPTVDLEDATGRSTRRAQIGITGEAVMPVGFLWGEHLMGKSASDFVREVNEELADVQTHHADRYRGMGILPLSDLKATFRELERIVESGLCGLALPTQVNGRNLDDPTFEDIWATIADARLPVVIHPTYLNVLGMDRFPRYYLQNSFGAPAESGVALMSVIYSGLLDRYPDLKLTFCQGGGTATSGIGRLIYRHTHNPEYRGQITESPETYLRRVHYDSMTYDDDLFHLLLDRVGVGNIMLGSDYPFGQEDACRWLQSFDWLTRTMRSALLWENAAAFLNWKEYQEQGAAVPAPG
jgi:aminocarboxymuconate-semialdehyde decarboxylase